MWYFAFMLALGLLMSTCGAKIKGNAFSQSTSLEIDAGNLTCIR